MKTLKIVLGSLMLLFSAAMMFQFEPHVATCIHNVGLELAANFGFNPFDHVSIPGAQLSNFALLTQFSKQVEKRPAPNNGFLQYCVDESSLIDGEKVVRPVEGDDPIAITDPRKFPLEVQESDDDSHEYNIALHATKPQRISDETQLMLNYNRRQLIIDKHMKVIDHKVAREILFNWSPTGVNSNIVLTTGGTVSATLAKWGATGNRKAVTKNDLIDAVAKVKEDDVEDGTMMLIPVGFEKHLRKISDFIDYQLTGRADMLAQGVIGMINGCKVMYRSTALLYNSAGDTPVKPTFTADAKRISVAAGDCSGILIWNPNYVYKAIGPVTAYLDPKSGSLLGSTVNFSQRAGGNLRKDEMGVVALVEATV